MSGREVSGSVLLRRSWGELSEGGNVRVRFVSRRGLSGRELTGGNCPWGEFVQGEVSVGEFTGHGKKY